ncbi:hypothetical protein AJ90_23330 [Vibrio parahaemolyticus M0605]|nr:hypothetical protein AJ90_23330 [Vibrio parahaemolyticus M0605]
MFKRNLISLAILVGLTGGLAGCNSDNDSSSSLPGDPIVDLAVLKYVDPMIGTAASGHTFPGATVPAGMVQLSPDTFIGSNTDHESGLNLGTQLLATGIHPTTKLAKWLTLTFRCTASPILTFQVQAQRT